jgi:hypothetical protein
LSPPRLDQPFVTGVFETHIGAVPKVSNHLTRVDRIGSWKARWGMGRMHYTVDPGLYALGNPTADSNIFVSANYKMSFDLLRHHLAGIDAWLLVLDTKGINVWCAAGKGTFGTEEIVRRVDAYSLKELVAHRRLIVPQLGAPGVSAHDVTRRTGFTIVYGPVDTTDLSAFIKAGYKATIQMREKTFSAAERLILVPVELVRAVKIAAPVFAGLVVLSWLLSQLSPMQARAYTTVAAISLGVSVVAGSVLAPLLLPWLPGRAFSTKGLGISFGVLIITLFLKNGLTLVPVMETLTLVFWIPAMTMYLAMNFTGCSTFTSLSGVRREMRWALPVEIVGTALGLTAWVTGALSGR